MPRDEQPFPQQESIGQQERRDLGDTGTRGIGPTQPPTLTPLLAHRIENDFSFHPASSITGPKHDTVRSLLKGTAHNLIAIVPEGREQSLMLTALEEAMMWANAGIARKF